MQQQMHCPECEGKGFELKSGFSIRNRTEVLNVDIEKGMKNGHRIKLRDMGDMRPGTLPADLVVTLKEKEHCLFKRKGADLLVEYSIPLKKALCGFRIVLEHLDGRKLLVECP